MHLLDVRVCCVSVERHRVVAVMTGLCICLMLGYVVFQWRDIGLLL